MQGGGRIKAVVLHRLRLCVLVCARTQGRRMNACHHPYPTSLVMCSQRHRLLRFDHVFHCTGDCWFRRVWCHTRVGSVLRPSGGNAGLRDDPVVRCRCAGVFRTGSSLAPCVPGDVGGFQQRTLCISYCVLAALELIRWGVWPILAELCVLVRTKWKKDVYWRGGCMWRRGRVDGDDPPSPRNVRVSLSPIPPCRHLTALASPPCSGTPLTS